MIRIIALQIFHWTRLAAVAVVLVDLALWISPLDWSWAFWGEPTGVWRWVREAATLLFLTYLIEWVYNVVTGRRRAKAEETAAAVPLTGDRSGAPRATVPLAAPISGEWTAVNSPADRVPSHGTHWGGQSHAIDLTGNPDAAPSFSYWRLRRPEEFPAFDSPVLAPADGTVVKVVDLRRDHRARTSLLGLLYFFVVEQIVRSFAPDSFVFGNHVVIELADGVFAELCHLREDSILVRPGDRVRAGQPIARVGNSGNSTEPHLHFQLMDSLDPTSARGIPFTWTGIGVPRSGERFAVPA
ncbi:M23 family metallopeptidase [Nocardia crassostreae]|uniref:M23 family metallopeptidase n=1 Tax=Nocardia crassostreae TaxID=53428 RepID=UPI00083745D9|nr:M23 family metallopeptidase [Nocardia crassostreae]